ncbi:insulin-like growth factor-binding protein complex acid labile subunit [Ceratina calcarata]|uniref:Insulin-like growth factor-binding protein complex acid labile subunit n=1 Tax=Ceratina calcarata TaxID=156304 RepID=A0AAJ7NFR9_9HYME|nr:insulin-like growth factor-binding protein complex acid labile subunit [Ceratina calcarata]XP_017893148.1 insulin-like growth factor-binding protein complex acid labile subunit [Ceratina calcarata]
MRRSIIFGALIVFPLIAVGNTTPINFVAELVNAVDTYEAADTPDIYEQIRNISDICENESLRLDLPASSSVTRSFIASSAIRCITLRSPGLSMMSGAFEDLPNLKYLDLRENQINPSNLFSFGPLPTVKVLLLGGQNTYYSGDIEINNVYPELEYLDLSNIVVGYVRARQENPFPKLKYLNFAQNKKEKSSFVSLLPNTLIYLDLSRNLITSYAPRLTNLSLLWLADNKIEQIGENGLNLSALKQLEILSVADNRISSIDEGAFTSLANLRYLNLSGNALSTANLVSLNISESFEILVLDRNSLVDIPNLNSSTITTLSLKCNQIQYLSVNSFISVPNLQKLILSNNKISFLHTDVFQNQQFLKELHLDDNKLDHLPVNWSQPMKNLRYLNLSGNKFTKLESLDHLNLPSNLEVLYLERNHFMYIYKTSLQMMPDNLTIYLNIGSESNSSLCGSLPTANY